MTAFSNKRFCLSFRTTGVALAALAAVGLSGCTSMGGVGPSTGRVMNADDKPVMSSAIKVVEVDSPTTSRLAAAEAAPLFSERFAEAAPTSTVFGPGDILDISIVEAPPAVLFTGGTGGDLATRSPVGASNISPVTTSRGWSAPQQVIDSDGRAFVPFAGSILVVGRTPQQVERDITSRLTGKAHDPQVMVRRVSNATSNVTVLGDVGQSGRYPLTARGERLLEVLAAAGGTKESLNKSVVQLSRNRESYSLPLAQVAQDPRQNIVMRPDDVVTVLFQPLTFTSLGASGTNAEVNFDGPGFTLSQALGRISGLQDSRANVKGVFVFRFENPAAMDPALTANAQRTPDGKIPVIYRVDLSDPASLFYVQGFPIKNKDVVYVSNAPLVDFNKFLGIISTTVFSVIGVVNTVP